MQRIIDGVGELHIGNIPVGSIEYQFQFAEHNAECPMAGRVIGNPDYLTKILTAQDVTVHGDLPRSSFRIFAQRYVLGDRKIFVSAKVLH